VVTWPCGDGYRSVLPESGDVNLFLVVRFANSDQLDPNKEQKRDITGEYLVRRIDIK
jgi:hypothetical protein